MLNLALLFDCASVVGVNVYNTYQEVLQNVAIMMATDGRRVVG